MQLDTLLQRSSMKYVFVCEICIILLGLASGLVHFETVPKGENGCKAPGGELTVGQEVQDDKTCGIFVCMDLEGNGIYHFCQKPVTVADCESEGIAIDGTFPDCCWQCVKGVKC